MCLRRPKKLQVPTTDPSKASRRPVGNLLVKVVRAQNLEKKGLSGRSNPYVKLNMSNDNLPSKKTSVKRSNLNPKWNEYFKFVVIDPENQSLNVNVFDWAQIGKHEKMGMNRIRLKEFPPEETKVTTLNLLKTMHPNDVQNEKSRGQITLEVTYKPFKQVDMEKESTDGTDEVQKKAPEPMEKKSMDDTDEAQKAPYNAPTGGGLLFVLVHEAQDLEGKHHTNPYTKITFKGEEKKTKVVKKNRDPRWEDEFEFDCKEPPTNDKLHVEVLSKAGKIGGILHGKETLGYIDIALADVISRKRTNDKFHLIDSKNGQIQIELQWRT